MYVSTPCTAHSILQHAHLLHGCSLISQLVVTIVQGNSAVIAIPSSLLCWFCISVVRHVPVFCMQLYFFGIGDQLLLLYMESPFLQLCCFGRRISILLVYLDPHAQHQLEDHDDLQILIKIITSISKTKLYSSALPKLM